MEVIVYDGLN